MALFNLIARLGLNASAYELGLKRAQSQTQAFGDSIERNIKGRLAAAFGVGGVIMGFERLIRATVNSADRIKDLSEQFGISTDEVQRLDIAAKKTGLSFEDFGTALIKIGAARKAAVEGNMDLRKTFENFGFSLDEVNDSGIEHISVLERMGQAAKSNPNLRHQMGDITGVKSGSRLFKALQGLDESNEGEAIFSKADLDRIDEAKTKVESLWRALQVGVSAGISNSAEGSGRLAAFADRVRARFFGGKLGGDAAAPVAPVDFGPAPPLAEDKVRTKAEKDLLEAQAKLQEVVLATEYERLDVAGKRAMLEMQIKEHIDKAAMAREHEGEAAGIREEILAEQLRGRLFGLKEAGGRGGISRQADELLQRGGFTGGGNANRGVEYRLSRMENLLRQINDKTPAPGMGGNGVIF